MNTMTDWIKMTDRHPAPSDLPVWVFYKGAIRPILYTVEPSSHITHWRPAAQDIPEPPREETQEEGDYAALVEWGRDENIQPLFTVRKTWHAALAWERAEVAKMLPPVRSSLANWETVVNDNRNSIDAIRARCAGGGK